MDQGTDNEQLWYEMRQIMGRYSSERGTDYEQKYGVKRDRSWTEIWER